MARLLYDNIYNLVKKIPRGRVSTYGQIACFLGNPRAARLVGWALNICPTSVPWQRVINLEGMISIQNFRANKQLQANLLKTEGVAVTIREDNFWIDLNKYLCRLLGLLAINLNFDIFINNF